MSLPIKPTPVLKGKDAIRFLQRMHEAETHVPTEKEKEEFQKGLEFYKKCKAKWGDVDIELP